VKGFLKGIIIFFVILFGLSLFFKWVGWGNDVNSAGANIGVIEIDGVIMSSLEVLDQIREFRKNKNLKALVVRVNSPGGAVGSSQEIFMELKKLQKAYPVVISMGDVAASGGLYVSLGGSPVYALPGTLTGSVGVLLQITNVSKLLEKIYIEPLTIKSGELKDAGNPLRPFDSKSQAYLQTVVSTTFDIFREDVKRERKLSDDVMKKLSDGRVVNGLEAVQMGLADKIGTFEDAVDEAKSIASIADDVQLFYLSRKPKSFLSKIFEEVLSPVQDLVRHSTQNILQYRWVP